MIHARRHESGISPSRASRSGPAVSCFFLGLRHALFSLLAFLPSFLSSVSPSTAVLLPPPFPLLILGFPPARLVSSLLIFSPFVVLLPCPLPLFSSSRPLILYLHFFTYRRTFSCLADGEEPKELSRDYVHPSALLSSKRLSFSLCVTPLKS